MTSDDNTTRNQRAFPDLSGEWTMIIRWQRGEASGSVEASVIIRYSPAGMVMIVRSEGSNSHTIVSQVGHDAAGVPILHYMYEVEPKAISSDAEGPYKGAAILRYYDDSQELSGNYWTSQLTKGHFQLSRKPFGAQIVNEKVDVLLLTAIPLEYDAAKAAFSETSAGAGVLSWIERNDVGAPYIVGSYSRSGTVLYRLAIAKPNRMGSIETGRLAATLVERLSPRCLVMCGVCAGNPGDVALGDIVVSELAYQYDEGKLEVDGFIGDHRQSPVSAAWKRAAEQLKGEELPSYGRPSVRDARYWLLERLHANDNPRTHPARARYFVGSEWKDTIETLEKEGVVEIVDGALKLTALGMEEVLRSLLLDTEPPKKLPLAIKVGPIASGNVVVKDGLTWKLLEKLGVRSVVGLEMEAATVGSVARSSGISEWIVIKGVMDHADPRKEDRYKPFAAQASAEALRLFLERNFLTLPGVEQQPLAGKTKPMPPGIANAEINMLDGDIHRPGVWKGHWPAVHLASFGEEKAIYPKLVPRAVVRVAPEYWASGVPAIAKLDELPSDARLYAPVGGGTSGDFGPFQDGYIAYWLPAEASNGLETSVTNLAAFLEERGEVWLSDGSIINERQGKNFVSHVHLLKNWIQGLKRAHTLLDQLGAGKRRRVLLSVTGLSDTYWPAQDGYFPSKSRKPDISLDRTEAMWSTEVQKKTLKSAFNILRNSYSLPPVFDPDFDAIYNG